jgi:hypothetical protein
MSNSHTRRQLLLYVGGVSAAFAVPFGSIACGPTLTGPPGTGFFTDAERTALTALANAVMPPDDTPGAAALGAVAYIERLCTAFDAANATTPPTLYAGGPFSGRAPTVDVLGAPTTNFPPNSFTTFLPLDRIKDAGWRIQIFGSQAFPTGAPNEALLGKVTGLRDAMKQGLATAIANAPAPLETLSQDDLIVYFNQLDIEFRSLLIDLVTQGCFCAPEYGGNVGLGGWQLAHYEGDQQPRGYSIWSTATNGYVERPEAPMTTAGGPDPEPYTPDVVAFLDALVTTLGGVKFS